MVSSPFPGPHLSSEPDGLSMPGGEYDAKLPSHPENQPWNFLRIKQRRGKSMASGQFHFLQY